LAKLSGAEFVKDKLKVRIEDEANGTVYEEWIIEGWNPGSLPSQEA
jgi:hypothetical protein